MSPILNSSLKIKVRENNNYSYQNSVNNNLQFGVTGNNRNDDNMKLVAFEMAKNYLKSYTENSDSQAALVLHEKAKIDNNFISKFVFVEHKETIDKKDLVYFKICVPNNINLKPYLDVFCPFTICLDYKQFLNSNLDCLKDLNDDIKKEISEVNKYA